jgi:hypothetical protein
MNLDQCHSESVMIGPISIYASEAIQTKFSEFFNTHVIHPKLLKLLEEYPQTLIFCDLSIKMHGLESVVFCTLKELEKNGCESLLRRCFYRAFNAKVTGRGIIVDHFTQARVRHVFEKHYLEEAGYIISKS